MIVLSHLNLVRGDGGCQAHRKLEDLCCQTLLDVLPKDWFNVGALLEPLAGHPLTLLSAMVRVVKLHNQSGHCSILFLNAEENSPGTIGEAIRSVHIQSQYHFSSLLQLQDRLEWSILHTSSIVSLWLPVLDGSVHVPSLDGKKLTRHAIEHSIVSCCDRRILAIDMESTVESYLRIVI